MNANMQTHLESWRNFVAQNVPRGGVCVRPKHHFRDFLSAHARKNANAKNIRAKSSLVSIAARVTDASLVVTSLNSARK